MMTEAEVLRKVAAQFKGAHGDRYRAAAATLEAKDAEIVKWKREAGKYTAGCEQCVPKDAEIERLKIVKTAALKIADERGKENVELRAALEPFAKLASTLEDAPNLIGLLTEEDFRRAAAALAQRMKGDNK